MRGPLLTVVFDCSTVTGQNPNPQKSEVENIATLLTYEASTRLKCLLAE
jgi:hypothetical protein